MNEITLLHVDGLAMGYARYGTMLHRGLTDAGVAVNNHLEDGPRTNVVAWVSVPTHARGWWKGQMAVMSTMWETDSLPESFRECLHEFDLIIVPSDQNVELFSRHHPNVAKVPLGVDPAVWSYRPRVTPTNQFNFLIGGAGERKGTDLAYKAFRRLWGKEGSWGSGPEPRLIMKAPKPEDFSGPRITRISGRISAEVETSLYASAHCYLQPSRGEGFGLQPLQAIAQGIPTILTDAHGHAGFAHLGYPLTASMTKAGYFIYGPSGQWWEPNLDELCDLMQLVYDNYADAAEHAKYGAEVVAKEWTWRHTAERFIGAVGPDNLAAPYSGTGAWYKPEPRLYRVRLTTAWKAEIAGYTYLFERGVDYWTPADVKRILFEAGILDVACLDGAFTVDGEWVDSGLTEEQVARAGLYRAEHSYCPTCGQKTGSGVTKADEIFDGLEAAAQ